MSASGDKVLGSYRLAERIGKGGMGEVYRAEHTKLGREAAVKILPVNLAGEEDFLKRFEREAASAAKLDHPNILPVWEYGEDAGQPYLVMPYVRGGTLKDKMGKGTLAPAEITKYLGQMADALDYAHGRGIIHRDVKPANMLVDDRGRLFLSDFGIAKALEGAEGLTRTGVGVGTPEYMAPEQAQGRADARSDLYALGVILYQMLTGRVPFSGNSTVEVLMKHMQDPLPMVPLRNLQPPVPAAVERVIQKALAKNPNERYDTGKALVEDFQEAIISGDAQAGAATVIGAAPTGNTPPPFGAAPPPAYPTGQATVVGGQTLPSAGSTPLPYGNTPPPYGSTPLPGGTPPPIGNTPLPYGGMPAPAGTGATMGAAPAARTGRNGLLIGGIAGALALLLLCGAIGAFALTRGGNTNATQTAQAQATGTQQIIAAANLAATQTTGAPTATAVPPTATTVPPTATTAPPPATTAAPPTAAPQPTTGPTATAPRPTTAPTTGPAAGRAPNGAAPAGWKTYSGTAKVPFSIYYPPNWTVDDSRANEGRVYFYGPGVTQPYNNATWVLIATTGKPDPNANVDVLRDQYYKETIRDGHPEAAIDVTRPNKFSGITFASLGSTFVDAGKNCYAYIGLGLKDQVPWRFRLNSLYDGYDDNLEKVFSPMISSLNIYANP